MACHKNINIIPTLTELTSQFIVQELKDTVWQHNNGLPKDLIKFLNELNETDIIIQLWDAAEANNIPLSLLIISNLNFENDEILEEFSKFMMYALKNGHLNYVTYFHENLFKNNKIKLHKADGDVINKRIFEETSWLNSDEWLASCLTKGDLGMYNFITKYLNHKFIFHRAPIRALIKSKNFNLLVRYFDENLENISDSIITDARGYSVKYDNLLTFNYLFNKYKVNNDLYKNEPFKYLLKSADCNAVNIFTHLLYTDEFLNCEQCLISYILYDIRDNANMLEIFIRRILSTELSIYTNIITAAIENNLDYDLIKNLLLDPNAKNIDIYRLLGRAVEQKNIKLIKLLISDDVRSLTNDE